MTEILKQGQYEPMPVEKQVIIIYAGISGLLDDIPVDKVKTFEIDFLKFIDSMHPEVIGAIRETKDLSTETEAQLSNAIKEFKGLFEK